MGTVALVTFQTGTAVTGSVVEGPAALPGTRRAAYAGGPGGCRLAVADHRRGDVGAAAAAQDEGVPQARVAEGREAGPVEVLVAVAGVGVAHGDVQAHGEPVGGDDAERAPRDRQLDRVARIEAA